MGNYDVIIVGAGPAGISTVLHLQQIAPELASRTLVLEKARFPRNKLCGGGVTPDAERILNRLGLDVTEVPHVDLDWAHFLFEGKGVSFRFAENYAFRVIHREELDAWLVRKARERDLTILEETPVERIVPDGDRVDVVTPGGTYRARVVVGADGAHSVVRRAIPDHRRPPYACAMVLWASPRESSSHLPDVGYFDFFPISRGVPGYVWDFPILIGGERMRSWGIANFAIGPRESRRRMLSLLAEEMARHGYRLEDYRVYGESVPVFRPDGPFSAPHILLTGDAVGVEGVFGEGIGPALGQGAIAAKAIVRAFETGDFSFREYRAEVLRSKVGISVRRRTSLAPFLYSLRRPSLQRFLWWRCGRIAEWVVKTFLFGWTTWGEDRRAL
ncbi:MAG: NAD(P)/FAD-dependent oxidoreductase [Anaerolineae bacterium]|nr:NAD(P)/FAD-dependent oxidoreductase [Anaerolineae bacterium]MCX8067123.1 NAD(P)/FAD-dependent oxidoreductase [Anaerolineae bacterium]MDW8069678.1 NAD(P)/FAD-dependent oxidoreductase [Anaerolineae bacterium]